MTVSQASARALQRVDDQGGMLMLLSIVHPALSGPVHVVNDSTSLTSKGIEFIGLPFSVTLPTDASKEVPRARLQMDNVGRDLTLELERLPPGAVLTATLRAVHRSTPNVIDYEFTSPLSGVTVDVLTVSATLGPGDIMRRPAVSMRFDPRTAPALFPG